MTPAHPRRPAQAPRLAKFPCRSNHKPDRAPHRARRLCRLSRRSDQDRAAHRARQRCQRPAWLVLAASPMIPILAGVAFTEIGTVIATATSPSRRRAAIRLRRASPTLRRATSAPDPPRPARRSDETHDRDDEAPVSPQILARDRFPTTRPPESPASAPGCRPSPRRREPVRRRCAACPPGSPRPARRGT